MSYNYIYSYQKKKQRNNTKIALKRCLHLSKHESCVLWLRYMFGSYIFPAVQFGQFVTFSFLSLYI